MADFATDDFNDVDATNLTAHTPDVGTSWTVQPGDATQARIQANRCYFNAGGAMLLNSTPPGADYEVWCDIYTLTTINMGFGPCARMSTSERTMISCRWNPSTGLLQLLDITNGVAGTIHSHTPGAALNGEEVKLRVEGTQATVLIDGTAVIGPVTTTITAAGVPGLRSSTSNAGATTGVHADNIHAAGLSVPTNTVAPVISGVRVVGEQLSTTDGTWTNTPTSYTYQWQRDGASISGATSSTYTLVTADAGTGITCAVTASNASGASIPASSNELDAVAEIVATDIKFVLAAGSGLGGSPGSPIPAPTAVFDAVSFTEADVGDVEYRAVYLKNTHAVRSLTATKVWIATQTTSPTTDLAIGVAPEAAGSDVTTIANESTPPVSVTFSAPSTEGAGLDVGTLDAAEARGVWLRRTVTAGTAELATDSSTLAWSGTPS